MDYHGASPRWILDSLALDVRILNGTKACQALEKGCFTCRRIGEEVVVTAQGPVPGAKMDFSCLFLHIQIDVHGPIDIYESGAETQAKKMHRKSWKNRQCQKYKGFVLGVCCLASGAVKFNLVTSLNTNSMVESLQRHFCAHGRVIQIFSDLQPSFLSAYKRLKDKNEEKSVGG